MKLFKAWTTAAAVYTLLQVCLFKLGEANLAGTWSYVGTADELINPERGFHSDASDIRTARSAGTGKNYTVLLAYCYLTDFIGKQLPQAELDSIQKGIDAVRSANLTMIVRFAYSDTLEPHSGPKYEDVFSHAKSLQPLIQENADSILTIQAGFVGYRGEWRNSFNNLEANHSQLAALVAMELFEWTTGNSSRQVQVASPLYKENWLLKQSVPGNQKHWTRGIVTNSSQRSSMSYARIGFHDDNFMSMPSRPEPFQSGDALYNYMTAESPFVAVDGSLGENSSSAAAGFQAAVQLRLQHYDTFSSAHGSGRSEAIAGVSGTWSTPLNVTELRDAFMPAQPEYLQKPHTVFEYIRDHLGYRLQVVTASYSITPFIEHNISFNAMISNFGFSAPVNIRYAYLVLLERNGDEAKETDPVLFVSRIKTCDPRVWHPYLLNDPEYVISQHPINHYAPLPGQVSGKAVWLGLHLTSYGGPPMARSAYTAVKLANGDMHWWTDSAGRGGVNIIGSFSVPN